LWQWHSFFFFLFFLYIFKINDESDGERESILDLIRRPKLLARDECVQCCQLGCTLTVTSFLATFLNFYLSRYFFKAWINAKNFNLITFVFILSLSYLKNIQCEHVCSFFLSRLLIVFLCWIVTTMVYYGLSFNASNLGTITNNHHLSISVWPLFNTSSLDTENNTGNYI
jgi:hypothetical protein